MVALLIVAGGCAKGSDAPPQPMGPMLGDGTSTSGTSGTTGANGTSTVGVSATSVATSADSSDGGVDSTGGAASTGDTGEVGSSTGPAPTCPPDPMDDACTQCGKEQCCPEYVACVADMVCSCTLDCYLGGTQIADCITLCGPSTAAVELYNCGDVNCGMVC